MALYSFGGTSAYEII